MKKLILSFLLLLVVTINQAQTNGYLSGSISIPNTNDFKNNAFPSIELGIMNKNISYGLNVGTSNLNSKIVYTELKTSAYTNLNRCNGYILFGLGTYLNNFNTLFIEYGIGISYSLNTRFDYTAQISNWDKVNYLSLGINYNFTWNK